MKRFVLAGFLAGCAILSAMAMGDVDVARERALAHFNRAASAGQRVSPSTAVDPQLRWSDCGGHVYVFAASADASSGYVITSGSDAAHEVLGYSDEPFPINGDMPDGLAWLIDEWAREIRWAESHTPAHAGKRVAVAETRLTPVAPLLGRTAWDQNYPYNLDCPTWYGNERSATGCVATAMAQIFYHHRYPAQGIGTITWTQTEYPLMGTLTVDLSKSVYDWEAMQPAYPLAGGDERANKAVARLMADCGAAVRMQYGPQSGAMCEDWPAAMVANFNYDPGVAMRWRGHYTQQEWDAIIRADIDRGLPVFMSGYTQASGGHAFVFDGYDAQGLFHVNWGWSAMSNGYFRCNALTPSSQGTGGATGGFNYRQLAITGIRPLQADTEDAMELVSEEALTSGRSSYSLTEPVVLKLRGKINNTGWKDVTVDFAVGIYNASGERVALIEGPQGVAIARGTPHRNVDFASADLSQLVAGAYYALPLVKANGGKNWTRVLDKDLAYTNRLTIMVDGEKIKFAEPSLSKLTGTMSVPSRMASGNKVKISFSATNTGSTDYYGAINAAILDATTGKLVNKVGETIVSIAPGATVENAVVFTPIAPAGRYKVVLVDYNADFLTESVEVELEDSYSNTVVEAVEAPVFADPDNVDRFNVEATAKIRCTAGLFTDNVLLYFFSEEGKELGCLEPVYVVAGEGEEATVRFSGPFENAKPDVTYYATLIDGTNITYIKPRDKARTAFRVARITSSSAMVESGSAAAVRWFSLQGVEVAEPKNAGIYIKMVGNKSSKTIITDK